MDTRWGFQWTHHTATAPAQHTQPHTQRESQPQPTTVGQVVEGNGVRGVVKVRKPQVTDVAERLCGLTVVFLWFDRGFLVGRKTTVKPQKPRSLDVSSRSLALGRQPRDGQTAYHTPEPQATGHTLPSTPNTPRATSHTQRATPSRTEPTSPAKPSQTEPHHTTPRQKQARPNQARPFGQGHFQFKDNVVHATASPVAALLIQWEKGCDEG